MKYETPTTIAFANTAGARPKDLPLAKPFEARNKPMAPSAAKIISPARAEGALTSEINEAIKR